MKKNKIKRNLSKCIYIFSIIILIIVITSAGSVSEKNLDTEKKDSSVDQINNVYTSEKINSNKDSKDTKDSKDGKDSKRKKLSKENINIVKNPFIKVPTLGVFYYPWTGGNPNNSINHTWSHWKDAGHNPPNTWASNYLPDLMPGFDPYNELYSAQDTNVTEWQLSLMERAGIDFVISSWWGQNDYTDQSLDKVFTVLRNNSHNQSIKFTIYYEKEGYRDVPKSEIINDINYIKNKYANSSNYFIIDGKPVIFVYNIDNVSAESKAKKWKEIRNETGVYTVLKVFNGYQNVSNYSDSWHQYAPSKDFEIQKGYSAFISPGFHRHDESPKLIREDFSRFENDVKRLKNASVRFKLIETWNEWNEGSGIEPAQKINHNDSVTFTPINESYGTRYIDIIAKYFGVSERLN